MTALGRIAAATREIDPPLAAVDVQTLTANAADLVRRAGGTPVRVASKSVRCRAVLEIVLGAGLSCSGGFAGIMAYSLREALWLAGNGAQDILVGYPSVDRAALAELAADAVARERLTVMIDSPDHLEFMEGVLGAAAAGLRVCLDVDASLRVGALHLGVRRSPLRTPKDAANLARSARARGFDVVGVMFYEAQIAGVPDSSRAVRWMKRVSARELATRRSAVVEAVESEVGSLELVNGGGTGSLELTSADPVVTEVTAGSGLFVPTLFDEYHSFEPDPALYFALPAVRRPASSMVTLFGGGYIASGPAGASRVPTPVSPRGLALTRREGAGEVQTPLVGKAAACVDIGDRVWFRHAKAGELCERFAALHLVADGAATPVPTYRGEGQSFA